MLSQDNLERFWDVCDDLGVDVDEDTVRKAWTAYCSNHNLQESVEFPVNQAQLFRTVDEALKLVGVM